MVAPPTVASKLDGLDAPVKLTDWWPNNAPASNLVYRTFYGQQCQFVSNTIGGLLTLDTPRDYKWRSTFENSVFVISTHISKSVKLPVFHFVHPDGGLELVMRNNFYDWKVSVISSTPVKDNFYGLFDSKLKVDAVYCEGFDRAWVFDSYEQNQHQFTIELDNDNILFTFLWLIINGRKS